MKISLTKAYNRKWRRMYKRQILSESCEKIVNIYHTYVSYTSKLVEYVVMPY